MRHFSLLMGLFVLMACSGSEDKSVTEELTPEELKIINDKHPGSDYIYFTIEQKRKKKSVSELSSYVELTYRDLFSYIKTINEKEAVWREEAKAEWKKTQEPIIYEALAAIKDGKKKYDNYFSKHTVVVEPIAFGYGPQTDIFDRTLPTVTLRIRNTRGKIDLLSGAIAIDVKKTADLDEIVSGHAVMGDGWLNNFTAENIGAEAVLPPMPFTCSGEGADYEDFKKMSFGQLMDKYGFRCKFHCGLVKEAKEAEKKALGVSEYIENAWICFDAAFTYDSESSEQMICIELVAEKVLNKKFDSCDGFVHDYIAQKQYETNELAYRFWKNDYKLQ